MKAAKFISIVFFSSVRAQFKCASGLSNLQVGHITLTDQNFKQFKRENSDTFILGVSDSTCLGEDCCYTELLLSNLKQAFDSQSYVQDVSQGKITFLEKSAYCCSKTGSELIVEFCGERRTIENIYCTVCLCLSRSEILQACVLERRRKRGHNTASSLYQQIDPPGFGTENQTRGSVFP